MEHAVFPDSARDALRVAYPQVPTHLAHTLADHPLLLLQALGPLAARMRPDTLEHNAATGPAAGHRLRRHAAERPFGALDDSPDRRRRILGLAQIYRAGSCLC